MKQRAKTLKYFKKEIKIKMNNHFECVNYQLSLNWSRLKYEDSGAFFKLYSAYKKFIKNKVTYSS